MKKKITMWCILFVLLVSLFVPIKAKAEMCDKSRFYYDADNYMICVENGYTIKLSDDAISLINGGYKPCVYTLSSSKNAGSPFYCRVFIIPSDCEMGFVSYNDIGYIVPLKNSEPIYTTSEIEIYQCIYVLNSDGIGVWQDLTKYSSTEYSVIAKKESYFMNFIYSEVSVYALGIESGTFVVKEEKYYEKDETEYSFKAWCVDAGLNCSASSNESASVIPYSYNSYWHIVRKTSAGKWLLTTIGNSVMTDNLSDYTLMYSEDNSELQVYNLYSGEDVNGYILNIRQYEYDTNGWRLNSYVTEDSRDTVDCIIGLGAGSGVDDTKIIAYTSTAIYDDGFNLVTPASTEYYDVTDTPTVTPEPTPGSGSSGSDDSSSSDSGSSGGGRPGIGTRPSVGGEASGGGGLDFIINLFTLIWTKICSVPMQVDGYSISLQQIFVYGALVSIVGGFIIKFIFRR